MVEPSGIRCKRQHRLNQPVTGDNVFADVNLPAPDGKINILDLIAVRNKLNTTCP